MIVIIPAYEPDEKLIKLVSDLKSKCNFKLLIIDDGSGEKYESIFYKHQISVLPYITIMKIREKELL